MIDSTAAVTVISESESAALVDEDLGLAAALLRRRTHSQEDHK